MSGNICLLCSISKQLIDLAFDLFLRNESDSERVIFIADRGLNTSDNIIKSDEYTTYRQDMGSLDFKGFPFILVSYLKYCCFSAKNVFFSPPQVCYTTFM